MASEIATTSNVAIEDSYDSIFPSLPTSTNAAGGLASSWPNESNSKLQVKRQNTTQVFQVPVEERRTNTKSFGDETNDRCQQIAQRFGVKVEICCSKDQSLHIVISGPEDKVLEAKRSIINEIQTKNEFKYKVPKELHKFIIGRAGAILKELQEKTCTTISIPKPDQNSDVILIQGPKDGIDSAVHEIQSICDEQSKTGYEKLKISKLYHPWIRGPFSETINQLQATTGAKINMPPLDLDKDEITITGDKEKVDLACAQVMKIVNEKKQVGITKVEFQITKSQHKFIIGKSGQTVQDIFKDYDVYVLVPRVDQNSETITLFGENAKIGGALTQVYAKANSIIIQQIPAPTWLHRYIIGDQYSRITKITADYPGTHVKFEPDNKITLEGPPDEIEKLKERLNNIIKELEKNLTFAEINIPPKFYGHVIGKSHENINKLKQDFGVQVRLTPENSDQSSIRVEGSDDGVKKAKAEIEELLKRLENERSKDIIVEQRYHSNLIGQGGKNIAEIRAKFNGINISIPNADKKSDIITVRGNKAEVEKCCKHLAQLVKDLEESNYKEEMHIFKNFHKMIIGKHGQFIRKIKDDTNTRIDVPADNSDSDTIVITGKKENAIKARKLIEEKVKELIKIEEDFVEIPQNIHNALIGRAGAIIKQIRKDCGGCIITFPPENKPSDKIILRGPREDIDKAKEELLKVAKNRNDLSYSEDVNAKLEYHKFLVGRKGNNINQWREKYNVRFVFPQSDGNNNHTTTATNGDATATTTTTTTNNDIISIFGKEENVKKARIELEAAIKSLEEQITDELQVDSKWHKNFTAKRGKLINKISNENCNVNISFPKTGNTVTIKGPKEAVQAAKKKVLEIVYELENQVTIEVVIPQKYHVSVIGKKGANSQQISEDYHVELQFPAKLNKEENNTKQQQNGYGNHNYQQNGGNDAAADSDEYQNGDSTTASIGGGSPSKYDVVLISGLKENCEKAKEALLKLVPISDNYDFPNEFHKYLLSNKADFLREVKQQHNVEVIVPKKGDDVNYVTLVGLRNEIDEAKKSLQEKLEQFEIEKKDRELKSFTVEFEIKPEYIQLLRGKEGVEAKKLGDKFGVNVSFSRKGEPIDKVIIRGYEKNALEAKEEILRKINEFDSKVSEEIEIDSRVHSRIIGKQGKNLKKITDKYKVDIRFPGRTSASNDTIIIQGDSVEAVDDAIDYLKTLEQEYLEDVTDRNAYVHPSRQHENDGKATQNSAKGFVVKGAPWEAHVHGAGSASASASASSVPVPDTTNLEDFPTISSAVGDSASSKSTWGPSRR